MSKMVLTEENYYSAEANTQYVSASQYKTFIGTPGQIGCEARGLAEMKGEFIRPETSALLVGQYVDSFFSGTLPTFAAQHPEIYSTRGKTAGELKSDFKQATAMIDRATRDELFMKYMDGDKQMILVGEISGVPCKAKLDSCDGRRITDLKTVRSINESFWVKDSGERLNFIEYWNYDVQLALYRELYRQAYGEVLPCFICAISKDKSEGIAYPRIKVIEVSPFVLDEKLEEIKRNIVKIQDLKTGVIEPIGCGICDYCSTVEVLDSPISSDMLLGEI